MAAHWRDVDYFTYLLKDLDSACSALEYMVDDLHLDKDHTVGIFLDHAGSEDFLWSLVKFLGNSNPRYGLVYALRLLIWSFGFPR